MKNYKDLIEDAESLFKDVTSEHSSNSNGKIIAAAAIGLAAGAILGILLAPASGTETRSTIADSLGGAGSNLKEKARQGMDKLADLKDQAVDAVKTRVQSTQSTGAADPNPTV